MDNEAFLKHIFINAQQRYKWAKDELESTFKDRIHFLPTDPLALTYKDLLKDLKKEEEKNMKALERELRYEREGLNPPYCYNHGKRTTE